MADITLEEDVESFTVEFWMKPTVRNSSRDAIFFSVSSADDKRDMRIRISKEKANAMFCYPQAAQTTTLTGGKVQFIDYNDSRLVWQHFACVFDARNKVIRAHFYEGAKGMNFVYYQESWVSP